MSKPTLLFFEQISDQAVGGKAKGLAELTQLGFNVPAGFVIQNAKQNVYPDDLGKYLFSVKNSCSIFANYLKILQM